MKITISRELEKKQEVLALGLFEEDTDNYKSLSEELAKELHDAQEKKFFSKKLGEAYSTKVPSLPYKKILVLGLGAKKEMNVEKLRQSMGKMVMASKCTAYISVSTNMVEKVRSLEHLNPEMLGR